MSNQDRPKVRVIALRRNGTPSPFKGIGRQVRMQRMAVILMGSLWVLAFATGCSRNTKNCSAYDGIQLELNATAPDSGAQN